jgi:hypothetical protein
VDANFDFSNCADDNSCNSNCTISAGAQRLSQYISNAKPSGEIMLIGYSLGGLIARDMIAYNRLGNRPKVVALITLGTPNAGYPFVGGLLGDDWFACDTLVREMNGDWRSQQGTNTVILSPYLLALTNQWTSTLFPGESAAWLVAAGRSCSNPKRPTSSTSSTGCRDISPFSDGVVCYDSAAFNLNVPPEASPNLFWNDPEGIYVHASGGIGGFFGVTVLCPTSQDSPNNPPLYDPPVNGSLFQALRTLINAYYN